MIFQEEEGKTDLQQDVLMKKFNVAEHEKLSLAKITQDIFMLTTDSNETKNEYVTCVEDGSYQNYRQTTSQIKRSQVKNKEIGRGFRHQTAEGGRLTAVVSGCTACSREEGEKGLAADVADSRRRGRCCARGGKEGARPRVLQGIGGCQGEEARGCKGRGLRGREGGCGGLRARREEGGGKRQAAGCGGGALSLFRERRLCA